MRLKIPGIAEFLVCCGKYRLLKSLNHYGLVNALFLDDLVDDMLEAKSCFHVISPVFSLLYSY